MGLGARWISWATAATPSPKLWTDAYLAAFADTTGCRLLTTDAAFTQFAGLDLLLLG